MTTQQHYDEVKNFVAGLPGMIGPYSDELACLTAAHRASKASCDLDTFRAILKSAGYEPQHRGSAEVGYHWQLSLPELQAGSGSTYLRDAALYGHPGSAVRGPDRE